MYSIPTQDERAAIIELVLSQIPYIKSVRAEHPNVIIELNFWAKLPIIRNKIKNKLDYMVNHGWGWRKDLHFSVVIK